MGKKLPSSDALGEMKDYNELRRVGDHMLLMICERNFQ